MNNIKPTLLALVVLSIVTACNKQNVSSDYLIFGHYYGECMGEECIETFKLTDTQIYEDLIDDYSNNEFEFEKLNTSKFKKAKSLNTSIPAQLIAEKDSTFGCPDCADGGGIFIRHANDGIIKTWRIDQTKSNIPDYLHDFIDKVNETISELD